MIPILALMIPIVAIIASYKHKQFEMRLKYRQQGDSNVMAELEALKRQITELRDTTTRYDMSFDAALQRIESRVGSVEQRVTQLERREETARTGIG